MNVDVIIPALDEEHSVGGVVAAINRGFARDIIVVDNGSTVATGPRARRAGARVVLEPRRGYRQACLAGIASLRAGCDDVVFLDADGSDEPGDLLHVVEPISAGRADLVVGARAHVEAGALTPQQLVGNALATLWLWQRYGLAATDLGPFRAIRFEALQRLAMKDLTYGWTVEMQIRAARAGLRYEERRVSYRRRIGGSKISGTVRGTLGASFKILSLLAWYDLVEPRLRR